MAISYPLAEVVPARADDFDDQQVFEAVVTCLVEAELISGSSCPCPLLPDQWQKVHAQASRQRVLDLTLEARQRRTSDGNEILLIESVRRGLKRRLTQQIELTDQALGSLMQAGIEAFPLKGIWLYRQLPQLGRRAMSDVDLIIPPSKVIPAFEVLRAQGFKAVPSKLKHRWHTELAQKWEKPWDSNFGRYPLYRGDTCIDLHWDPVYLIAEQKVKLRWTEAFSNDSRDRTALLFTHLLVHTAHSGCEAGYRLRDFLDVGHLIRLYPSLLDGIWGRLNTPKLSAVKKVLEEVLLTASRLVEGEWSPAWEIMQRERHSVDPFFRGNPWQFFLKIRDARDRALFLLGYLESLIRGR